VIESWIDMFAYACAEYSDMQDHYCAAIAAKHRTGYSDASKILFRADELGAWPE